MEDSFKTFPKLVADPTTNEKNILAWKQRIEAKIRLKYLHGKIVEEKGWKVETAERKMALDILGDKEA